MLQAATRYLAASGGKRRERGPWSAGRRPAFAGGKRPASPARLPWKEGRSAPGGTPAKRAPQHMSAVPLAPGVASRTKPGTVPPRKRGYRPEVMR